MSRSLKVRASAQKKRNQTIDIGSYHCPVTLATKIASLAGTSLAGGNYLIHVKSEGVRSSTYARNLLAGRDCFPLGFDSCFAAANLICIKSDSQILDLTARFLDPS
jgi:hypothetical protein